MPASRSALGGLLVRVATVDIVFEVRLGEGDLVRVVLGQRDTEHRERDSGQLPIGDSIEDSVTRLVICSQDSPRAFVIVDLNDDLLVLDMVGNEPVSADRRP
ncbi:hypothetical protein [Burkholderia orbicola]|uniref:hypothetical protein n=1 Tax=Burkholderia orbicola TaxID=2978683 RepID=UPI002FE1BA62